MTRFITLTTIATYTKTASGKSWKSQPDKIERVVYTEREYKNYTEPAAIKFFNYHYDFDGSENGASCRAYRTKYTSVGYNMITRVVTISPHREYKIVTTFEFIDVDSLEMNAGYRERDVIKTAKTFEYFNQDKGGSRYITLFAGDRSVTFDSWNYTWIN